MHEIRLELHEPPVLVVMLPVEGRRDQFRRTVVPLFEPAADPEALDPEVRASLEDLTDRLVAILYPNTVTHFHRAS